MPPLTQTSRCEHTDDAGESGTYCTRCGAALRPRGLSPALTSPGDRVLALVTLAAAATSIAALLLQAAGWARMPFTITFVTLPGMVLLACITIWAGRSDRRFLFNRIWVGFAGGTIGLIAYDVVRLVVQTVVPLGFNAFQSLPAYGSLMTGRPVDSAAALWAGWVYHISNGLTFGAIYAIIAGPARWWWGLAWGAVLELSMLVVLPAILRPSSLKGFLLVNVVGHAAFGLGVGVSCERWAHRPRRAE